MIDPGPRSPSGATSAWPQVKKPALLKARQLWGSLRTAGALVLLFTVLAVAVVWWQSLSAQDQLREKALLLSQQRGLQLAGALSGQMDGIFNGLDVALTDLRQHWMDEGPSVFDGHVRQAMGEFPQGLVSRVTVLNAQGIVVYGSHGSSAAQAVVDRDHYLTARFGPDRLVLGTPARVGLAGDWELVAGRPILRDGRVDGAIHLAISTRNLAGQMKVLQMTAEDIVALVHPSGLFQARSADNDGAMGRSVPTDRPFLTQRYESSGTFRDTGARDRVPRLFGWHRLQTVGSVLVVGLADEAVLAPLEPALRSSRWLTIGLSMLLLSGGGLIASLLRRDAGSRAALAASEQRLRSAQAIAKVGSWDFDMVTRELVWSDETYRIFDCDRATVHPTFKLLMGFVHPDDREHINSAFSEALRTGQAFDVKHRAVLADGRELYLHELCVFDYENQVPIRGRGTVQDITETRIAQLELQRLNDELEQRVEERTRELAALNRELEAFAYSVSHDLRTPLRTIHGFASLLEEDLVTASGEAPSHLRRIQDAARRMGVLITDLLSMAHHGLVPLQLQRVNLSELAQTIAGELERVDPGLRVRWHIEAGLQAQADPLLMRVVLQNLLGNAWKYTGQVAQPEISFSASDEGEGMQGFCVRDNGAGFDMTYVDQLFQPFKRLHSNQQFEGSGIGLATVQRVVQRHGGRVRGEGQVGQGAAFFFSLPDGRETAAGDAFSSSVRGGLRAP